jgi:hypothetical protein
VLVIVLTSMQWVSGRTVRHTLETAGTMKEDATRPVITTEVNEKAGRQRRCALLKLSLALCIISGAINSLNVVHKENH